MRRLLVAVVVCLVLPVSVLAQSPQDGGGAPPVTGPGVTLGVLTFLQYAAELEEADNFNAFDVTRGYIDIRARLSDRVRARLTPDLRRVTDTSLTERLTFGVEYAYLEADVTDASAVAFGLHPTPWLAFEETINRYRAQGPLFAERTGLVPGPSDLGASLQVAGEVFEVHAGVYNGEGYAQTEFDRLKSVQGRVTVRPFRGDDVLAGVGVSGYYSYGWYAEDRPRRVAIVMGSFEHRHVVATAQYLQATDNPFVAADLERRGLSFFGEARVGPTGWAGLARLDLFDPDASDDNDKRRRYIVGGAHWSQLAQGRLGIVISLEQVYGEVSDDRLESRLLVQTHVEF
jgi:hypothetical protein